jgi:hypothetical protein
MANGLWSLGAGGIRPCKLDGGFPAVNTSQSSNRSLRKIGKLFTTKILIQEFRVLHL